MCSSESVEFTFQDLFGKKFSYVPVFSAGILEVGTISDGGYKANF